ncbi:MAG: leucine-rich repeat protein [Saccharofermentanales bacterium]
MRRKIISMILVISIISEMLTTVKAEATPSNYFTYRIVNNEIEITGLALSITTIEIPSILNGLPVTSIGEAAFKSCPLRNVVVPDSVINIGTNAFADTLLTSISIPKNVTHIGIAPFFDCDYLTAITVDVQNISYDSLNGVLFTENKETIVQYPKGLSGEYILPDGVKFIGNFAFANCKNVTKVVMPDGVQSIGEYSFDYIRYLYSVSIPNSVTSIGNGAFRGCGELYEMTIPNNIISIGQDAFRGCNNIHDLVLPDGLKFIGSGAFRDCHYIRSVVIPESITTIESNVFYSCLKLNNVSLPETITAIKSGAFAYTALTNITLPSNITSIADLTFFSCVYLTNIVIPNKVTSIGHFAFEYCINLTSITIPSDVAFIGNGIFKNCYKLDKLVLPDNLKIIPYQAFWGCTSLVNIQVPENLEEIGESAFQGCTGIVNINIPNTVTTIRTNAFKNCNKLATIILPQNITIISEGIFNACSSLNNIIIPNKVVEIKNLAFYSCISLSNIEIPNSVTQIGSYAFSKCSSIEEIIIPDSVLLISTGIFKDCISLQRVNISSGLQSITDETFYNCVSLNNIYLPETINTIGKYAFYGCTSLTDIDLSTSLRMIDNYAFSSCSLLINTILPTSLLEIGNNSFEKCISLKNIILPEFIVKIGDYAFTQCTMLTKITIPESVTNIGIYAFSKCSSLESIILSNKLSYISNGVFSECSLLKNIIIPNNVNDIGDNAFELCKSLSNLLIPDSVISIGNAAFASCISLKNINIPNGILSIGDGTFYSCIMLDNIIIPSNVTSIGEFSFRFCKSLRSINLPDEMTSIGKYSFADCSLLGKIIIPRSVTFIDQFAFQLCPIISIYGYSSSYAQTYAINNSINFKCLIDVTFNTAGGSDISDMSFVYDSLLVIPTNPVKPGYIFCGWYKEQNYLTKWDFNNDTITENITLYAKWATFTYIVTFKDWDGTILKNDNVEPEDGASAPPNPFRSGYTFNGWDIAFDNINDNLIVTAQYTKYSCVVRFLNWNGNTIKTETVLIGNSALAPSDPFRTGYIFTGWDVAFNNITDDLVVTAQFRIKTYTVTFLDWSEKIYNTQIVNYGESAIAPDDPLQNGYNFLGWKVPFNNIISDLTVYALYSVNIYTVTYKDWNGNILKTQMVNYYEGAIPPENPQREGYIFIGWDKMFQHITGDLQINALYTQNKFTVTFKDWNENILQTEPVNYGESATAPDNPSRLDYAFIGWDLPFNNITDNLIITAQYTRNYIVATYKDWDGTILKTENALDFNYNYEPVNIREGYIFNRWSVETDNITGNITGTALYIIGQPYYVITFKDWDGSILNMINVANVFSYELPPNPIRPGYTFIEWYATIDFENKTSIVTAQYRINNYSVNFIDWDGSILKTQNVEPFGEAIAPTDPSRNGYAFTGWDTSFDNITMNTDITAQYTKNVYTVTFKDWDGAVLKTQDVEYGERATAPADPSRVGYTFTDWDLAFDNIIGNSVITAGYSINNYTIIFNAQGGSNIASKNADYNSQITAPEVPSKIGYTFNGWYKDIAGINVWSFATDNVTQNTTLFAKWTINKYSVTFLNWDGATIKTQTVNYAGSASAPMPPVRVGYDFIGWDRYFGNINSNLIVNAEFTPSIYIVSFNPLGGSEIISKSAYYNTLITSPASPTRPGYKFVGWYFNQACTSPWQFASYKITKNTTLYAKWLASNLAGLRVLPNTYNSLKLTWIATPGASYYQIYRSTSATGTFSLIATQLYTSTMFVNAGLTPGTTYYYKIRAYALIGTSKIYSNLSAPIGARTVPATIGSITVARYSSTGIKVNWGAIAGASGYEIYRSTSSAGTYMRIKTTTTLSFINTGLLTGRYYYYKVRAYRLVGTTKVYGGFSPAKSART